MLLNKTSKSFHRIPPRGHDPLAQRYTVNPCSFILSISLSHEEKGNAPLSVDSIAYVASTWSVQSPLGHVAELGVQCTVRCEVLLALPNQRALIPSANFAPLSEVKGVPPSADSIAYPASAPKGTNKVPSHKVRTKVLCSANHLRRNAKIKAPLYAKSEATTASLPALSSISSTWGRS